MFRHTNKAAMAIDVLAGAMLLVAVTAYGLAAVDAYWMAVPVFIAGTVRILHTSILAIVAAAVILQGLADGMPQKASRAIRRGNHGSFGG